MKELWYSSTYCTSIPLILDRASYSYNINSKGEINMIIDRVFEENVLKIMEDTFISKGRVLDAMYVKVDSLFTRAHLQLIANNDKYYETKHELRHLIYG